MGDLIFKVVLGGGIYVDLLSQVFEFFSFSRQ
jgi:hypothetical protein